MKIKVKISQGDKTQKAEVEGAPEVVAALLRGMADQMAGKQPCTCSHHYYHRSYPMWGGAYTLNATHSTIDSSYALGGMAVKEVTE